MYDVVVVGGGILGLASAYYIKEFNQGLSVAVSRRRPTWVRVTLQGVWAGSVRGSSPLG
jgi:glycine/D-amino acid oxidase-like deaminating enzyme